MKGHNSIAFSITSNYDSIKEEKVFFALLTVLMAYANKLIGESNLRLSKNKGELAYDMSMEAIKIYLEDQKKFNPSKNPDLVKFIKFYILRSLISNFKELKGQQNELIYEDDDSNGIAVKNKFIEYNDPGISLDLDILIEGINTEISEDEILKELFELRYCKDFSRAEIIEELKITPGEYNNRIRRLDIIRKRVIANQEIEL